MAQSDDVVVVLDDHDFRGRSIALVIESSAIDATCHYHDIGDGIHVDRLREIAGNRPGVVLAVIAVGGTSLQDEGVLAAVAAVRSAAPTARVAMLCDDTSAGAVEFAVEAEIDGIVPTYLRAGGHGRTAIHPRGGLLLPARQALQARGVRRARLPGALRRGRGSADPIRRLRRDSAGAGRRERA